MKLTRMYQVSWTDEAGVLHGQLGYTSFEEAAKFCQTLQNVTATVTTLALGNGGWVPIIERVDVGL